MQVISETKSKYYTLTMNTGRTEYHEQFYANGVEAKKICFLLKLSCIFIGLPLHVSLTCQNLRLDLKSLWSVTNIEKNRQNFLKKYTLGAIKIRLILHTLTNSTTRTNSSALTASSLQHKMSQMYRYSLFDQKVPSIIDEFWILFELC